MIMRDELKQQIMATVERLPEDALKEVVAFLEDFENRQSSDKVLQPRYLPVALGGLWKGAVINDEDIAEARREMWGKYTEGEP